MDEVVEMPVVIKSKDVWIRRVRRIEGCHRSVVGERAVYLWKVQSGRISLSWTGCNHDQLSKHQAQWWSNQEGRWIIVQEFMSAVCGVRIGMDRSSPRWTPGRHSQWWWTSFNALDTCKDFFVVSERSEKGPEHREEGYAGDGEDRNRRVHSEFERSCAEKPERVRPEEVCEVSSTTERKTRHQLKVQNWRGERSMR